MVGNHKPKSLFLKIKIYLLFFIIINLNTFEKFVIKKHKKTNSNKFLNSLYYKVENLKIYCLKILIKIIS
jgi:hypothetical protein